MDCWFSSELNTILSVTITRGYNVVMIALIQRVREAHIEVDAQVIADIGQGLLVFVGIEGGDSQQQAERLVERILGYRVFPDVRGRMNLSVSDINGGVLLVPQFTLVADTRKGMRPSFSRAAAPEQGKKLFNVLLECISLRHECVAAGRFGVDMQIYLINDGPVTFWLQTSPSTPM